jgi:DNA-directed RNA polymerase sigma subunit (sigma70/sigma32)
MKLPNVAEEVGLTVETVKKILVRNCDPVEFNTKMNKEESELGM